MALYEDVGKAVIAFYEYVEGMTLLQSAFVALSVIIGLLLASALMVCLYVCVHRKSKDICTRRLALVAGICTLCSVIMVAFPHLLGAFANMAEASDNFLVTLLAFCFLLVMMPFGKFGTDVLIILPTLIGPVLLVGSAILWIFPIKAIQKFPKK